MQKLYPGMRFTASYSGGKDSLLAIYRAVQSGMVLQSLLITYNTDRQRSWFHGIPTEVLEEVAAAMGVPVHRICTTGEGYGRAFEEALRREKEQGAQACVFGDIDIQGHLEWGSQRCAAAGLEACFPLWQEDRLALTREGIRAGFRPRITVIDRTRLSEDFLGRLLTEETLEDLQAAGVDVCGENGECHTFVADGPLFSRAVPVQFQAPLELGDYLVLPMEMQARGLD